jgi:hypothetical protein
MKPTAEIMVGVSNALYSTGVNRNMSSHPAITDRYMLMIDYDNVKLSEVYADLRRLEKKFVWLGDVAIIMTRPGHYWLWSPHSYPRATVLDMELHAQNSDRNYFLHFLKYFRHTARITKQREGGNNYSLLKWYPRETIYRGSLIHRNILEEMSPVALISPNTYERLATDIVTYPVKVSKIGRKKKK